MSNELNKANSIKLILHPGHAKCGSSSIQDFIYSNIQYLKQLDIYVPDKNFRFLFDTQELLLKWENPLEYFGDFIFSKKRDINELNERLKQVIKKAQKINCQTIIVSSENLGSRNEQARKVHELFASYFDSVTVIYYIRTKDSWLVSSWQQWTHKEGENFQNYLSRLLNNNSLNFLKMAEFFEEIYGAKNLNVVPISKKALLDQNLINDFCYRSQIKLTEKVNVNFETNKGLNPYLCEILARISNIYESRHDQYVKNLFRRYVSSKTILYDNDKNFLDNETREKIRKHFENDNRLLQQKYFNHVNYDEIFEQEKDNFIDSHQKLEYEIEKLKDVIAIQMEMIITLLRRRDEERKKSKIKTLSNRFYQKVQNLLKK